MRRMRTMAGRANLPDYITVILGSVFEDVLCGVSVRAPLLAKDDGYKDHVAHVLIDLARAGQIDRRELTRTALAKGEQFVKTMRR